MSSEPLYQRVECFLRDRDCDRFKDLALACFVHQFERIPAYRAVCERRGATPASIADWREIPAVPTLAFKHAELCAGPAERVFLTTGTTQGREQRGRHALPYLALYEASAVAGMRQFLFPDVDTIRIAALVHRAAERPESSLAQMVDWAFVHFGADGGGCFVRGDHIDVDGWAECLRASERDGEPLAVLATSGALIRGLDGLRARGWSFRLPHGSRLMDTGGAKGAPRPLSARGLLHLIWECLAIPGYLVANEYGMTEMCSQFYDNVIRDRVAGRFGRRAKVGPHWLRTRVLDPISLRELPFGERGVLCHTDLANAGSALVVLTEDVGRQSEDGLLLEGRVQGAEARGCSLALAEFRDAASG